MSGEFNPDASEFFRDFRWRIRFDAEILAAASPAIPKVKNLQLEESAPGSWLLSGSVGPEETRVDFWKSGPVWDFETDCSCNIGAFCHHAAALLLKAEKEKDPSRLTGRGVSAAVASYWRRIAALCQAAGELDPSGVRNAQRKAEFWSRRLGNSCHEAPEAHGAV